MVLWSVIECIEVLLQKVNHLGFAVFILTGDDTVEDRADQP